MRTRRAAWPALCASWAGRTAATGCCSWSRSDSPRTGSCRWWTRATGASSEAGVEHVQAQRNRARRLDADPMAPERLRDAAPALQYGDRVQLEVDFQPPGRNGQGWPAGEPQHALPLRAQAQRPASIARAQEDGVLAGIDPGALAVDARVLDERGRPRARLDRVRKPRPRPPRRPALEKGGGGEHGRGQAEEGGGRARARAAPRRAPQPGGQTRPQARPHEDARPQARRAL